MEEPISLPFTPKHAAWVGITDGHDHEHNHDQDHDNDEDHDHDH